MNPPSHNCDPVNRSSGLEATHLINMLMLGNLLRESGVVKSLNEAAHNEIANIATIFLGITTGSTMSAISFLDFQTITILVRGLIALGLDTIAGLFFSNLMFLSKPGQDQSLYRRCRDQLLPHG